MVFGRVLRLQLILILLKSLRSEGKYVPIKKEIQSYSPYAIGLQPKEFLKHLLPQDFEDFHNGDSDIRQGLLENFANIPLDLMLMVGGGKIKESIGSVDYPLSPVYPALDDTWLSPLLMKPLRNPAHKLQETNASLAGYQIHVGKRNNPDGVLIKRRRVSQEYLDTYVALPLNIINLTSCITGPREMCENLDVSGSGITFKNGFPQFPTWLYQIEVIGLCPSRLQVRSLTPNTFPPKVVEVHCLCQEMPCSNGEGDYVCTPVTHQIPTWIRYKNDEDFLLDVTSVTVGCVCAQRQIQYARNLNRNFVSNRK